MSGQVDEVKRKVDIIAVIGSRIELKRAGKYFKGVCPFHSEKSPSFFASPELQIYKCFGCGASGDVFSFLQAYEGLSFREALEDLADKVGVKLEQYQATDAEHQTDRLRQILVLAAEFYHFLLTKHSAGQKAQAYLKERSLPWALVEQFQLGWAPESWDTLTSYLSRKKGFSIEEIEKAGLCIVHQDGSRKRAYDRFRGRVIFPLTDFRGRIVGFSGRLLDANPKEAKYINSPETALYRKRELLFGIDQARSIIRKKDQVIIVEGEFDVLSSVAAGVHHVVAIKGSALTEEQIRLLQRVTKKFLLCLDVDTAGEAATRRGIQLADQMGAQVDVLRITSGKDPDDIARAQPSEWKNMVKSQRIPVYQFYIESAFKKYDTNTATGKKEIGQELVPMLAKIENTIEQAFYIKEVANRLEVSEDILRQEMQRSAAKERLGTQVVKQLDATQAKLPAEDSVTSLEKYVWSLLLKLEGGSLKQALVSVDQVEWSFPALHQVHQLLVAFVETQSRFDVGVFAQTLSPELTALVGELYLEEKTLDVRTTDQILEEIVQGAKRLRVLQLKKTMNVLRDRMVQLERESELDATKQADLEITQTEFGELTKQLSLLVAG